MELKELNEVLVKMEKALIPRKMKGVHREEPPSGANPYQLLGDKKTNKKVTKFIKDEIKGLKNLLRNLSKRYPDVGLTDTATKEEILDAISFEVFGI